MASVLCDSLKQRRYNTTSQRAHPLSIFPTSERYMTNFTPFRICTIISSLRLPFLNITRSTIEIIPCQSSIAIVDSTAYFRPWKESQPQTPIHKFKGVNSDCIQSNDGYVEREMEGFGGAETAEGDKCKAHR